MAKDIGGEGMAIPGDAISRRSILLSAVTATLVQPAWAQFSDSSRHRIGVVFAPSDRFAAILDATLAGAGKAAPNWTFEKKLIRSGIGNGDVSDWISQSLSGWVLLGTEAISLFSSHKLSVPAVGGLQYLSPGDEGLSGGVSLEFDPEAVFPSLRSLLPNHNRVHAIYLKGRDDWIVERLRQTGAMRGYSVLPAAASSLGEATDHFSGSLRYGNPATDIIWVLGGPGLITRDTSAHLFQQAYNARFPVFANRRAWVNDGAFLGGEPDFFEHGRQLVRVLQTVIDTQKPAFETSAKISLAMNVRVARRVGVSVTQEVRDQMGALVADD